MPGIRYAAAGMQAAGKYGLAGGDNDVTSNALGSLRNGGDDDFSKSAMGWAKLRREYRAVGGGIGGRYRRPGAEVSLFSAGVPSSYQPGLAATFPDEDFTDAPFGLGSWGLGDVIAVNYTDRPQHVIPDESMVGETIQIGNRPINTAVRGLSAWNKGLGAIINPSDEFSGAVQDLGAWPGGGVVTDMYATLSPDTKNAVDTLVRSGVQLYDAIQRATYTPRMTSTAVAASSVAMPLLLAGAAYLIFGSRRSRRR